MLKINSEDEIYRLLGYYATADGDFTETKRKVMERTRQEVTNIQHHPLEANEAVDLFISKAVGYFRFSAAIVTWSQRELENLHRLWKQGYKAAWHLPAGTADAVVAFPKERGALAYPNPWAVLTQSVIEHINRGLMHEDVVKKGRNSSVAVRLQTSRINPTSKRAGFKDSAIEECKEEQRPGLQHG